MKEVQEKLLPGELGVSPRPSHSSPKNGGQGVEVRMFGSSHDMGEISCKSENRVLYIRRAGAVLCRGQD